MRNTKLITISILPELLDKLNDLAREESRTKKRAAPGSITPVHYRKGRAAFTALWTLQGKGFKP